MADLLRVIIDEVQVVVVGEEVFQDDFDGGCPRTGAAPKCDAIEAVRPPWSMKHARSSCVNCEIVLRVSASISQKGSRWPQSATRISMASVDSRWKFLQAHDHGSFLKVTEIQGFASRSVRNRGFPGMSVAVLHVGFMVRPLVPSALVLNEQGVLDGLRWPT